LAQAISYLVLHLPDRYCRVFRVLEELLLRGMLPLGDAQFAAIDIGAGPGPGIFAIRNFYAALSRYASTFHGKSVSPLNVSAVVERSEGMARVMHYFAEHLVLIEQGRELGARAASPPPSPYAEILAQSATPFGASHYDFSQLDLRADHVYARHRLARDLEDELDIGSQSAMRLAHEEPIGVPSAFALAIMTNFLTTTDAVPIFEQALGRLMQTSLVPGGTLVVLGGVGAQYPRIYAMLDNLAKGAGLRVMDGFEQPLRAGRRLEERKTLEDFTRSTWTTLAANVAETSNVRNKLTELHAQDIFDESIPFLLPKYRVRVYRRGGWPRRNVAVPS
jgi:ribosomal protein RSM22 (predicted rRNA methylase)